MLKDISLLIYSYNVELCLYIQRTCKNKFLKYLAFAVAFPILIIHALIRLIADRTIGTVIVSNIKRAEKKKHFEDELSVVAIAKNEGEYIEEWLAYYETIGVDRVYLYENNGTDNMKELVQPFVNRGFVVYHDFPGDAKQLPAYNHAIREYGHKTRYMAMVDCDEFLMPVQNQFDLRGAVNTLFETAVNSGGIGVNWCVYGSSNKLEREPGLLMERFKMRANSAAWNNKLIKTIVNPRLVKRFVSPHFAVYKIGAWCVDSKGHRVGSWYINDVDFSILRCNHYFCKSVEEFKNKQARGLADRTGVKYDMSKFEKYDVNDIEDSSMDVYVCRVKEIIKGGKY